MNLSSISNTSQKLGRTLLQIRDALAAVPDDGPEQRDALRDLRAAAARVWRSWIEHTDNVQEAVEALSWVLGEGTEEVEDLAFHSETEFYALAAFEREVRRATEEAYLKRDISRERLVELLKLIEDSDRLRQHAERRVIRAFGAVAFTGDTW